MKSLPLSATVFLIAATAFITYQATYMSVEKKHSETIYTLTDTNSAYTKLNAVDEIVRASYINEIDEEELENGLITGYLYGIGDKYASYLTEDEYTRYINQSNGSQVGIGVNVIYSTAMEGMYVTSVMDDGPAMQSGIRAGDILYAVDGESITERGYYDTLTYIAAGEEGTPLTITVKKGPDHMQTEDHILVRKVINNYTVSHQMYDEEVGYLKLSSFTSTTPDEFKAAMESLQNDGAKKFVFDVRFNSGGELMSIKTILDQLLPEGPIIRIYTKDSGETTLDSDASCIDAPMVVLVNENTASAAELFASALRDYGKAKLVGKTTFGKGTMQTMTPLSPQIGGGALSFSTGMYNPPYSDNYEGKGLVPDVDIDLPISESERFYELTLGEDSQFNAALRVLYEDEALRNTDATVSGTVEAPENENSPEG